MSLIDDCLMVYSISHQIGACEEPILHLAVTPTNEEVSFHRRDSTIGNTGTRLNGIPHLDIVDRLEAGFVKTISVDG